MKQLLFSLTRLTVLLLATLHLLLAQSATYNGPDTSTQGNWTGHYGSDGYQIANNNSLDLSYGSASISASAYTWTSTATGSPALQTAPNATTYIASGYLASTSFTINVNLTDGNSHTVAFYLLDWDSGGQRAESITVQNAATGASFPATPTESFTGFNNGVWVSYTVTGNVNFIISSTNSYLNAVVSGVFFSAPPSTAQSQSITFNSVPAQTVGTPLTLTATATSGLPVTYSPSPSTVCTVAGATATFLTAGNCTITASQAGNSDWAAANPVSQTFTVSGSGSSGQTTASYVTTDATTGGNWTGQYGSDGYQIANDNSLSLSYGSVSISAWAYTWTSTASGSPALQTAPNASTYIASGYLASNSFTVNVNLTDGKSHTVAFYLLDWDSGGQRAESITVQNATTGASFPTAPTQSFTGFNNGVWVSYTVTGNVNFVFQSTNPYLEAIVSGVFFSTTAPTSQSQTITFNPIPAQTVGTPLTLTATATSGLPVTYSPSPSTVCTVSGATATFLTAGSCTITASQAGNSEWAAANPISQAFTVSIGSSGQTTASYVTTDATTGGNWTGQYGSDGYQIADDNSLSLSYGSVSVSASGFTWTTTASGSPALQTAPNASTYIASGYLASTSFTINVNLTDGNSHTVAFYLLDWDTGGQRAESITVQNAATGATFPSAPTQTFTGFNNGIWVSYTVTGNVNFVISSTNSYLNAVVSGVFFSTAGGSSGPPPPVSTIPGSAIYAPASGGTGNIANFTTDYYFNGGETDNFQSSSQPPAVDTSETNTDGYENVYQNDRYGIFSYTLPNLTPGEYYTLNLHFAEIQFTSAGQRQFNVSINNTTYLSNFDIVADAGAANRATVKSYRVAPDATGKIAVSFSRGAASMPKLSGLELFAPLSVSSGTASASATVISQISAGSSAAAGSFSADTGYVGGTQATYYSGSAIDLSGVNNPAPAAVYQAERYGSSFSYTIANLAAGQVYTVRLHFAENVFTAPGQRQFNVLINNAQVLTNFDIFAAAGAANRAIVRAFPAVPNSSGQIVINFASGAADSPKVSGVELVTGVRISSSGAGASYWEADRYYNGGGTCSQSGLSIDTSEATNPAPAAVYENNRYGFITYTIPNLSPNTAYQLNLHFAETVVAAAGDRQFNVDVNGTRVLTNFDIVAEAGAANRALVAPLPVTANSAGQIIVHLTAGSALSPIISGLELVQAGSAATQVTISGTVTANSSPLSNVLLTLSGSQSRTYTTGSNGIYSFTVPSGGTYAVMASLANYTFTSSSSQPLYNLISNIGNINFSASSSGGSGSGSNPGSLSPNAPLKEYIYFNGQIIAIEHAH